MEQQLNEAVEKISTGGKRVKKNNQKPLVVLGAVAAVLAAAYVGLCAYANSLDTFYPNRHINGIDVGGLTVSQAQEKLETELLAQEIEITNNTLDTQLTITVADLGYTAEDFEGDAAFWMETTQQTEAFLSRGWSFLAHLTGQYPGGANWPEMDQAVLTETSAFLAEFFSLTPIDTSYTLTDSTINIIRAKDGRSVSADAFRTALEDIVTYSRNDYRVEVTWELIPAKTLTAQDIYDQVSGKMQNAGYDAQTHSIIPEKVGAEFDVEAAQAALDAAEPGETVEIPAEIQFPTVTADELETVLFRDVLGEARTHVSGTAARKANVKLSAASINGYVMNTGDIFSYNEAVGQRTAANGYQPAPAYVKGETVDEIGGGICQTSSTLYLACLRGNLEITERYAHRYVPAYIPWGMDATVSWGGPDYKFTNDTDYPIKIVTEYANNYLTVRILGTNIDGSYTKVTNQTLSTTPWETVYQEDATVAPGTQTVKTTAYTGYKVQTFHTIYDKDGKVVDRHFEATSNYKARNKVILVAPGELPGAEPKIPASIPAEIPETPAVTTPETPAEPPAEPPLPVEPAPETESPETTGTPIIVVPDLTVPGE